jgi:hypothetical protein
VDDRLQSQVCVVVDDNFQSQIYVALYSSH